jgi:hypothetical protein
MSDKLLQTLSQLGLQDALLDSLSSQAEDEGWGVDSSLLDKALLSEEDMLEALSEATALKPVNLNHFYPDFSLAKLLLPEWCQQNCCVPLCEEDEALHVAVGYPPKLQTLDEFSLRVGRKLLPWIAIECRIQQWLSTLYGLPVSRRTSELLGKLSQSKLPPSPPSPKPSPKPETTGMPPPENPPSVTIPPADDASPSPSPDNNSPPLETPPKHSSSNVVRDFFIKIKRQLFSKREEVSEPENKTPSPPSPKVPMECAPPPETLASRELNLARVPQPLTLETPQESPSNQENKPPTSFSSVDEGLHVETLLEELLANVNLPLPQKEAKGPTPSREETENLPRPQQKKSASPPLPPQEESLKQNELPWVISFKNSSSAEPAPNWTLDEAREQLRLAQADRDKLTTVLLRFGLCTFEFVGLFSVLHGKAQGFSCAGKGTQEGFLRTRIDLAAPGLFHSIAHTMSAYFGPPPNEPTLQCFLLDIHRRPRSIFIYPIAVGDKLVAILYGDSGQNPLKQKQFSDFTLFCQQLPATFHELLCARRKQTLPLELDNTALQERIAHAITWLLEADVATQNAALEILGQTPEASAKILIQFFPGPQSNLLSEDETSTSLSTLGPIAHALLQLRNAGAQVLTPLLSSDDKKLRSAALKLAGVFASPEHLEPVLLALSDTDPKIASIARTALPHFKTLHEWPKALHLIQHSLNVKDPLRRTLAAKAVAAAKDRGSIETLIEWTGDSDAWVAETAAWALQQLSCVQLGPSPNLWKKWWLRAQHERRAQWLVLALESESFEQRKQAIDELAGAIGDTFHFAADASEEERMGAVKRWRQFVAQNPTFEL